MEPEVDGRKPVPHIKERAISLLRSRTGQTVTVSELAEELGVSRQQVFNAMSYIVRTMHPLVRKVASGVYMMGGDGSDIGTPRLVFEIVTKLPSGVLVKDGDGNLFKLEPVDL